MEGHKSRKEKVVLKLKVKVKLEIPAAAAVPSSGTKFKDAKRKAQASIASSMSSAKPGSQKYSKSVSSMLEKHNSKTSQPSMEHCTKESMEAKQIVDDHVADFFYENGIPLNAVDSRSWEILLESIGQYVLATDHLHIMK